MNVDHQSIQSETFFILTGFKKNSIRRNNSRKEKDCRSLQNEDDKIKTREKKYQASRERAIPNIARQEEIERGDETQELPLIKVEKEGSETDSIDDMTDDKFIGESEEDAAMRREALQCLRSSRRRGSEIQDEIPDSSVRMDLHTLYLEATGHKMNDAQSRSLEGKTPWAILRSKFSGKKVNVLESLRELLEEMGACGKDLVKHDLVKYKNMHWTDLSNEKLDQAALESLPSKERKRLEALWELFHAEVTYITDHLLVLKEVFYMPMIMAKKFGFLDRVDPAIVFGNLDTLIQASTSFAESLYKMFDVESHSHFGNSQAIVNAFRKFNHSLHPEYHQYCLNYSKARGHLNSQSQDIEFKEFMKWSEADFRCNRRRLNDLLVAPVQHLTKYPLLLKAIKSNTTKLSNEYDSLMAVISSVQRSIKEIEGELHVISNIEKIREISNNLIWPSLIESDPKAFIPEFMRGEILNQHCNSVFANPWRVLLLEGYLTLLDHTKTDLYVLLFDDMILMTKHRRGIHGKFLKRRNTSNHLSETPNSPDDVTPKSPLIKRSTSSASDLSLQSYIVFKQPIPLDRVKIYDCDEYVNSGSAYKHAFILESHNRFYQTVAIYTLQTTGSKEKNTWVQQMRTAKKNFTEMRYLNKEENNNIFEENNNISRLPSASFSHSSEIQDTDSFLSHSKRVLSSPSLTSTVDRFRQGRLRLFSIPH